MEPTFDALLSEWGNVSYEHLSNGSSVAVLAWNFSTGETYGRNWTDLTYAIDWISGLNCGNIGPPCAHQDYWLGNVTADNLSGPYNETYGIFYGGPSDLTVVPHSSAALERGLGSG